MECFKRFKCFSSLFFSTQASFPNFSVGFKAALKFGSEIWVLKKREEQRLEAAQMKFLRHLLVIKKLDKEKNRCIREKTGAQNIVKEIKQNKKKVATALTEDGQK